MNIYNKNVFLMVLVVCSVVVLNVVSANDSNESPLLHYTDLFENGATPVEKQLVDWLYGLKFAHSGATIQKDFGVAGRGMVYTKDVKRGEELFAVPTSSMVYTSNPHISRSTKRVLELFREYFREPGLVADDFELTEMALVVMFEKRNPQSHWAAYFAGLQFPLCPAFYTEDQMSQFEYPWLTDWRRYFLQDSIKNFARLIEKPEFELLKSPTIEDEFMWAASTVLQRSFDWGPDARREYVMVPYLDMINHRANISNNYYYSAGYLTAVKPSGNVVKKPIERGMVLGAPSDAKKGEEVVISYSMGSSNVQMLLQYGFLVPDNHNDYVVMQLRAPPNRPDFHEVIKELGGVLASIQHGDYSIPLEFAKAVSLVMTGKMDIHVGAYELIRSSVEADLNEFSTTLEADVALLEGGTLSRTDYGIVSYRVEAKKFLKHMLNRIDMDIATLKAGGQPEPPSRPGRKDWPLRHIVVQPPSSQVPPKNGAVAGTDATKKEL